MSIIDTTPATRSPEEILAKAKEEFGFEPFLKDMPQNGGRAKTLLDLFRNCSLQEREALSEYIMSKSEGQEFRLLHRTLRIVNGLSGTALCAKINAPSSNKESLTYKVPNIVNMEQGDRFFPKNYIDAITNARLFALPEIEWEIFYKYWQASRTDITFAEPKNKEELFREIRSQIAAYKKGDLPLSSLMTRNQAIRSLLGSGGQYLSPIARQIFPKENKSYLHNILSPGVTLSLKDEPLQKIAAYFDIDIADTSPESEYGLLQRLPYKTHHTKMPKHFSDSVKKEMTAPEARRVFNQPEQYQHIGQWLRALRIATQRFQEEIGDILGLTKEAVRQIEGLIGHTKHLPAKHVAPLLDSNAFNLPVDEDGNVTSQVGEQFTHLARCPSPDFWEKYCRDIFPPEQVFIPWEEVQEELSAEMRAPITREAWKDFYEENIAPEIKTMDGNTGNNNECHITLEARQITARIEGKRIYLNNGQITDLCKDGLFLQRLKFRLQSPNSERASAVASR